MTRLKSILNVLLYYFIPVIIQIIFTFIYAFTNSDINKNDLTTNVFQILSSLKGMAIMMIPTLVIVIILNYDYIKAKLLYSITDYKNTLKYGIGGYLVTMALIIAYSLIITTFNINVGEAANQQAVDDMISGVPVIAVILIIGIIVPFLEELIFRMSIAGLLLKDKVSKSYIPYIIMGLIFAFIHEHSFLTAFNVNNILNFTSYLIPSLALAIIYKQSDHNILATFIVHMLNNIIPTLLS